MEEIRNINGIEFEITPQVVSNSYHLSLPSFVHYYGLELNIPITSGICISRSALRELYFELRDRLTSGDLQLDKSIKPSSSRKWLADRGLTLKDLERRSHDNIPFDNAEVIADMEDEDLIDQAVKRPSKPIKQITTIPPKVATQGLSRKDQVRELINGGTTSPTVIAGILGTNASYVQRLKKEIENE